MLLVIVLLQHSTFSKTGKHPAIRQPSLAQPEDLISEVDLQQFSN